MTTHDSMKKLITKIKNHYNLKSDEKNIYLSSNCPFF